MRGHSVGGFGSVTTNKVIATIAGDVFGKDVQAYPKYGSEKKGLPTTYYLTIADEHIYTAQRAGVRRARGAQRRQARSAAIRCEGLVARGQRLHAVVPLPTREDVWERIPARTRQNHHPRQTLRVYFA